LELRVDILEEGLVVMKVIGVKGLRWRIWDRLDLGTLLAWKNVKAGASISSDVEIQIPFAWSSLGLSDFLLCHPFAELTAYIHLAV
jgi:hypothetical protein